MQADATPIVAAGLLVAGAGGWWWSRRAPPPITLELLRKQNADTSAAIIKHFRGNKEFQAFSKVATEGIVARDKEDIEKLQPGIQLAIDKKVLPASVTVEKVKVIQVDTKNPAQVATEIIVALGDAPSKGCIMTMQGWSGTGKGTTVSKLQESLPKTQVWSNGNIFRSLTLLALTQAEQTGCELKDVLTPELLAKYMGMLEFGEFNGQFDTKIEGLGLKHFVSEIQNTKLKAVGKHIPTVAQVSQGEVIGFVQGALDKMSAAGFNVLVEGREQTLNYIRSPHRFELVLKDTNLIGMRRAAQIMGGTAWDLLKDKPADLLKGPAEAAVEAALLEALAKLRETKP